MDREVTLKTGISIAHLMGGIVVFIAMLLWNSFNAGRDIQKTYPTTDVLEKRLKEVVDTEANQHDGIIKDLHSYSDSNRSKMESELAAYQTQNAQAMGNMNSQLQIQGVKIDQVVTMIKDLQDRGWNEKKR